MVAVVAAAAATLLTSPMSSMKRLDMSGMNRPVNIIYVVLSAQELSNIIVQDAGLPTHGKAGLQLGAAGAVTTIRYNKKHDGCIEFDKLGWKNLIEGKPFKMNAPVLIVMRNTNHLSLDVMIKVYII